MVLVFGMVEEEAADRAPEMAEFSGGNRLQRIAKLGPASGLDLREQQDLAAQRDQIDFAEGAAVALLEDFKTLLL